MFRIGLAGYGFGGRYFHAPLIDSLDNCRLAGVVTRSEERRHELTADYENVPAFDTVDELIEAGVDAIVLSIPPRARFGIIENCLRRGIPTISDKPFALNLQDARILADLSQKRNVPLTAYMNRRWDSDFLTVEKLIRSGDLGKVRRFYSGIESYNPQNEGNPSGGGLLRDLGSHLIDQAYKLFGPVESVYARVDEMPFDRELNNAFFLVLNHRNGMFCRINGYMEQHAPGHRFKVDGTEGCFIIDGLDIQTEQAIEGFSPASEEIEWGVEPEHRWGFIQKEMDRTPYPSSRGDWREFYRRFVKAVQEKGEMPVTLDEILDVTAILDACLVSSRENRVVSL